MQAIVNHTFPKTHFCLSSVIFKCWALLFGLPKYFHWTRVCLQQEWPLMPAWFKIVLKTPAHIINTTNKDDPYKINCRKSLFIWENTKSPLKKYWSWKNLQKQGNTQKYIYIAFLQSTIITFWNNNFRNTMKQGAPFTKVTKT